MHSTQPKAALLVGVNDYAAYDASLGNVAGTSDLRGAVADVKAWYVIARRLGIPAEQIEVRTSPELTAADMPIDATGTRFGPATRAAILDGLQALGAALHGTGVTPGLAQGLLTWSGHGAAQGGSEREAGTALLCPADVTGPELAQAISYEKLAEALDAFVPEHALTIVLDTCHAGPSRFDGRLVPRATRFLGSAEAPVGVPVVRTHDRVLAACGAGATSQEYHFQGVWHGAFTWAATTVLERWPDQEYEGASYIGIDHTDLLGRTAALLQGAAFAQTAQYSGPAGDATVPFGYPTSKRTAPGESAPEETKLQQIDPGQDIGIYIIKDLLGTTVLGFVISTKVNSGVWKAKNEYWAWKTGVGLTPFPTTGWTLSTFTGTLPNWVTPAASITFVNKPFPATSGTEATDPQTGAWFALDTGSGTPCTGWFNAVSVSGAPNTNNWFQFGASGSVPPWIIDLGGPAVRFVASTVTNPLYGVSKVVDPLSTNP